MCDGSDEVHQDFASSAAGPEEDVLLEVESFFWSIIDREGEVEGRPIEDIYSLYLLNSFFRRFWWHSLR